MKFGTKKKRQQIGLALAVLSILYVLFVIFYAMPISKQAALINTSLGLQKSQDVLRENPKDPVGLRGMAEYFVRRREFPQAVKYWRQAVGVEPDNDYNKSMLAMTLLRARQPEEGRRIYQELASKDGPEKENAQKILAKLRTNPNWGYRPRATPLPTLTQ